MPRRVPFAESRAESLLMDGIREDGLLLVHAITVHYPKRECEPECMALRDQRVLVSALVHSLHHDGREHGFESDRFDARVLSLTLKLHRWLDRESPLAGDAHLALASVLLNSLCQSEALLREQREREQGV
ncbi:MAG: hypothetical protein KGI98_14890 [Euryarchaeota archaeon]|nr:hypothetical protein [Euryarchaeota archaeon]MDE1879454.1 hypothetical protein [Euryarchaeota archaeon]